MLRASAEGSVYGRWGEGGLQVPQPVCAGTWQQQKQCVIAGQAALAMGAGPPGQLLQPGYAPRRTLARGRGGLPNNFGCAVPCPSGRWLPQAGCVRHGILFTPCPLCMLTLHSRQTPNSAVPCVTPRWALSAFRTMQCRGLPLLPYKSTAGKRGVSPREKPFLGVSRASAAIGVAFSAGPIASLNACWP